MCFVQDDPHFICSYSITSANDFTRRDPWAWRFLGKKNDKWQLLDSRSGEVFDKRHQRRDFQLDEQLSKGDHFTTFRLEILRTKKPNLANTIQIAEVDLQDCHRTDKQALPRSVFNPDLTAPEGKPVYTEKDIGTMVPR